MRAVILGLWLVACTPSLVVPPPTVDRSLPDGTAGDCAAMCSTLKALGGCDMLPRSMSCQDACERQMSVLDDFGEPIATMRPACLATIESCAEVPRCGLD